MTIEIKRGDVFCSSNPSVGVGLLINAVQWLWSRDGSSTYSHSGVIISDDGQTLEALPKKVESQDFLKAYSGDMVLVARPIARKASNVPTIDTDIDNGLRDVLKQKGNIYPWWRIPMHIIPPLAKIMIFKRMVCSELVAYYLYKAGSRHDGYKGTNPDTLADEWRNWNNFDIIFEGKL